MRNFNFRGCTWTLKPDPAKRVHGTTLSAAQNRPFSAEFVRNSFPVEGSFDGGELITTGSNSGSTVTARFTTCKYQAGFGTSAFPTTHIATLHEHGSYSFTESDFAGLNLSQAIQGPPPTISGGLIVYQIS